LLPVKRTASLFSVVPFFKKAVYEEIKMNAVDIITKTKRSQELSQQEIKDFIMGYVKGDVPDYQMSAWLMAVCKGSLTEREILWLTETMGDSGDRLDMSAVNGITVDKHSTGGIGDKTSLVAAPICAACGIHVPKMSGRGLGFTGGTIDKLESIPGFNVNIDFKSYAGIINRVGTAIIAQSGKLVPADKKMYALRDVTATVDSIPLICSSIMSKKLATGCDCILLDVKTGSGAFMKNLEDAERLAELMVNVGKSAGRKSRAVITDMDQPLGFCVGNALEVIEAVEILKGNGKGRLTELCIVLAANMLELAGKGDALQCRNMAERAIADGSALEKFREMVTAQGGDSSFIEDFSRLPQPEYSCEVRSSSEGYVNAVNSEEIGICSMMSGAGRSRKGEEIDSSAGIVLNVQKGSFVKKGELLMTIYSSVRKNLDDVAQRALSAVSISEGKPEISPIVYKIIK
jgi:pyrimidine-nucleoside phosphorylase